MRVGHNVLKTGCIALSENWYYYNDACNFALWYADEVVHCSLRSVGSFRYFDGWTNIQVSELDGACCQGAVLI